MAHFAHVDPTTKLVTQVIVIEQDVLDARGGWEILGVFKPVTEFVQTSYNTYLGVHKEGGVPLRKNYAGIGYQYDTVRDAFIPKKEYNSWVFNEATCVYNAPKTAPVDGKSYVWDEKTIDWVEYKSAVVIAIDNGNG